MAAALLAGGKVTRPGGHDPSLRRRGPVRLRLGFHLRKAHVVVRELIEAGPAKPRPI